MPDESKNKMSDPELKPIDIGLFSLLTARKKFLNLFCENENNQLAMDFFSTTFKRSA